MSFTDELSKLALLLFAKCLATIINTRSLKTLVAITQNVFFARSPRAETAICGLATTGECYCTLVP